MQWGIFWKIGINTPSVLFTQLVFYGKIEPDPSMPPLGGQWMVYRPSHK